MNVKNLTVPTIFVVSLLLGAGFWAVMTFVGDRGPKIQELTLAPETFRFAGGKAQVRAKVSDDQGVEQVRAVLLSGESELLSVDMVEVEDEPENPVYSGEFRVPANVRSDGESMEYRLRLVAVDTLGQESRRHKDFNVPAPGMPPDPPD